MEGRSISKVERRFKGGSGDDGSSNSSGGPDAPKAAPPRLRADVRVLGGSKLPTSVDADTWVRLELAASGAEETLLPFVTLDDPLFLKLADRGILQVAGDEDGNMSAIENERLGVGSCLLIGSLSGLGFNGGTTVWNPMAVDGLLRFDSGGPTIPSSGTWFDELGRIEVARSSVGGPLAWFILLLVGSFRFGPESEFELRLNPSLVGVDAWGVKKGSQVSRESSYA